MLPESCDAIKEFSPQISERRLFNPVRKASKLTIGDRTLASVAHRGRVFGKNTTSVIRLWLFPELQTRGEF